MLISRNCQGTDTEFLKLMAQAGYTAVDMNDTSYHNDICLKGDDERLEYFGAAAKNIRDAGLVIGQCHAPHSVSLWCSTPEEVEQRVVAIENCIKTVNQLDIPYTIIHPFVFAFNKEDENPERLWQMNIDIIRRICKCATNTTVCLENMPGVGGVIRTGADMARMLDCVGDPNLMVCLDTGHLFGQGEKASDFFAAVGDKIRTLHIHDSIPGQDLHLLAGTGRGDWGDFKTALKEYNYQGTINSESNFWHHAKKFGVELELEGQILERKILESFVK